MNRRNFVKSIMVAGATFNILPGAHRLWVARREIIQVTKRFGTHPHYPGCLQVDYQATINGEDWGHSDLYLNRDDKRAFGPNCIGDTAAIYAFREGAKHWGKPIPTRTILSVNSIP
jgi:hypothetical protein